MDQEVKARWVEALRSGKYKQGQGSLHNDEDEFCCLGVLCEIQNVPSKRFDEYSEAYEYTFSELETKYVSETQIPDGYCEISPETMKALIQLNDDDEETFYEIADYIEETL